ncbi:MAG: TetR/AcrR family transcriptional regulator [Pseudomonadota bacterium]
MTDRKSEIIDAATDLFMQKGFSATSMAAVASQVGIKKPSLYHHFQSKEDLFIGCIQAGYLDHIETLEAVEKMKNISAFERLEQMQIAVFDAIIHSTAGRMSPIIAETTLRFPEIAKMFHAQFIDPMYKVLVKILEDEMATGTFRKVDVPGFQQMFFSVPVNLSLSRAMFASVEEPEVHFDVEHVRQVHLESMTRLLRNTEHPI